MFLNLNKFKVTDWFLMREYKKMIERKEKKYDFIISSVEREMNGCFSSKWLYNPKCCSREGSPRWALKILLKKRFSILLEGTAIKSVIKQFNTLHLSFMHTLIHLVLNPKWWLLTEMRWLFDCLIKIEAFVFRHWTIYAMNKPLPLEEFGICENIQSGFKLHHITETEFLNGLLLTVDSGNCFSAF